mgnify:CR=1 FL=1
MKVYIGDKVVKTDKLERLDNGTTVTNKVYKYGNNVIKIFHGNEDELFYRYFVDCNLKLNVISTPIDLVYNKKNEFIGNTSKYIDGLDLTDNLDVISDLTKKQLLLNLNMLKYDLLLLKKYKISTIDLRVGNCIYKDGILYHVDYGGFRYISNISKIDYKKEFDRFICDLFSKSYQKNKLCIPRWIINNNDKINIINEKMNEYETVGEFIKRYK